MIVVERLAAAVCHEQWGAQRLQQRPPGDVVLQATHLIAVPAREAQRPVVQKLLRLMDFRNTHTAFDGGFDLLDCSESTLRVRRANGAEYAELDADFIKKTFTIRYSGPLGPEILDI